MNTIVKDLRYALRTLLRSRSFALTVVATLALGIGLNAAIFTVVDCVLLRPLGYRDADRIVAIETRFNAENRSIPRLAGKDYEDLLNQIHGLESTASYAYDSDGISLHGKSLYTAIAVVSPRFMQVMGVQPLAGRLFNSEDHDGLDAVVTASFVRNSMATAPTAALGQTIRFNGSAYTVVGVLPYGFTFPAKTEVWFEAPAVELSSGRSSYNKRVVAKRRSGVSEAQLTGELAHFSSLLQQTYDEDRRKSIEAVPLQEQLIGRIAPTLNLLMGSVAVILLIVCANLTHLLLVRAMRNLRVNTIRTALGASRSALAVNALGETVILATLGTAGALLLAIPALHLLIHLAPADTPRLSDVHLNLDVIGFSFLVSLAVMVLATLLPVWRSWRIDPSLALRSDSSRSTESRASARLRDGFIVAEIALTLTLSVAAIMLTRQLIAQSRQDLGFSPDSILTLDAHTILSMPTPAFTPSDEAAYPLKLARLDSLLQATASVPGVASAAAISGAPMGFGGSDARFAIKGSSDLDSNAIDLPDADMRPITPGFFATLGVPLLNGRFFSPNDRIHTPLVVLINHQLAAQFFPSQNPIGHQLRFGYDNESYAAWSTIVGVVGDIRSDSSASLSTPTVYLPIAQHPRDATDMQLIVRTAIPPATMLKTLEGSLLQSHPDVAIAATTMVQNVDGMQQPERFRTTLFSLFAVVSILLAAVGMYGVTAYSVTQRRFEFGLRFALGANRAQVLGMVLRRALGVAFLGIVVGIGLSLAGVRLLASVVGKLPGIDIAAYVLATVAVLFIALCATLLPARRASTIDPMTILRSE